jgi:hypothetical protein
VAFTGTALAGGVINIDRRHAPTVQSRTQVRAAPAASVCKALLGYIFFLPI